MYTNNTTNSVSISVSDDEPDDHNRSRQRARRIRKKSVHRVNNELIRRVIRFIFKYWVFLIFIPAAGLLVFEATRIGRKPSNQALNPVKKPNLEKGKSNLNRLDRVTRAIGGGLREPCLKLLSPEELEQLSFPAKDDFNSPVKELIYVTDIDDTGLGRDKTLSQVRTDETRYNLFTGNQTLDQRQKSFEVSQTVKVHCGFCSENGGFRYSDEDRSFMETCKVVVSTCAFGGGDDLYDPIGMSKASQQKVCYVAFWDEITLAAQESEGHKIGKDRYIGKWRIVVVKDLPFADQRLNGKIPKMLAHRLFPNSRYSIWVDSKSQFRRDPLGVLDTLLWRKNSVLAISEHGARSSVYDEAKAVVRKNKATPQEVEVQINQYRQDGFPEVKRLNGKKALCEASVIVREHTALSNLFMCLWFNEVVRFTSRDQLSFPYVLWRLNVLKHINVFPVCTRKDLVNSMGHRRKPKPLLRISVD